MVTYSKCKDCTEDFKNTHILWDICLLIHYSCWNTTEWCGGFVEVERNQRQIWVKLRKYPGSADVSRVQPKNIDDYNVGQKQRTIMCWFKTAEGKAWDKSSGFVAASDKVDKWLKLKPFICLAGLKEHHRVWDVWATAAVWERNTDSFLFPLISCSAALLSVSLLPFDRFLRPGPVISRSNGCEVISCLVFSRAASNLQE